MSNRPLVYVVDDNRQQAEVAAQLLELEGFTARIFDSGEQFLKLDLLEEHACLLLDNTMPGGMSGLEVQAELGNRGQRVPIVFMSGDSEFRHVVQAMKAGAYEFLQKPFNSAELGESIRAALDTGGRDQTAGVPRRADRSQLDALTRREKQVLELLSRGFTNKMIAAELGIVVSTVEFHRANLMRKLAADSLADLIAIYRG